MGVYLAHFSLQVRWLGRVTAEPLDLDALCRAVVCLATTPQKMMSSGGIFVKIPENETEIAGVSLTTLPAGEHVTTP